jgi:tetratricopeptide (TPR) repeat protein
MSHFATLHAALLRPLVAAVGLSLALSVPAGAAEDDAPDVDDTVSGRQTATAVGDVDLMDRAEWDARLAALEGRPHPPIYYLGSEWLGIEPEFIAQAHTGLDQLYLRDYQGALKHFGGMGKSYSNMAIAPVGRVLVWQAMMLENFDFKYESQYQTASRDARQQIEEVIRTPGNDAWEYFLLAGMLGIESIHTMRHEEYAKALSRGYEAMKAVKRCQEMAPEFVDIQLGDGLFDYWATVISQATKLIPDIGDKRAEGIRQMLKVEERSLFLRPPATLALTFTWIEEGKRDKALASSLKNHERFPDNIINNLVLGRVYMYNRKYDQSEATFKGVQQVDPKNERSHYYLGRLYLRWAKKEQALASFDRYLEFPGLSPAHRAYGLYYKGQVHYRLKDYRAAEAAWKEAWRVGKLKRAKSRLDKLKEREAKAG